MRPLLASFIVVVLGLPHPARAQSNQSAIVTDRPDFTESSEVINRGGFQFESGMAIATDGTGADRVRAFAAPFALMRIGLAPRIELRLGADGYTTEDAGGVHASGYSDFGIGAKVRLFDQDQIGVDLAVLPILALPVGSDEFSAGRYNPAIKIAWAREMAVGFDLTGNVNVSALSDAEGRFHQEAVSLSVGHDLAGGWGSYAEIYGFSRIDRDGGSAITFNGGVTRPIGQRMQFDVEAGHGLTGTAVDWFLGAGFAIRGSLSR